MKLGYFQLEAALAKQLSAIYLVSGEDLLLKQDAMHWIRKAGRQAGFQEKLRLDDEACRDEAALYPFLNANSLLASKRILELDYRHGLPTKAVGQILEAYAEHPSSDTILILNTPKIDAKIAKSAWYKALEKAGTVINIWPITRENLPKWLMERAKKYKLILKPDAANLLADYIEGNLSAGQQALEKMYLLKPSHAIDVELIQDLISNESRFNIFDFVEHLIAGNKQKALQILASLQNEGIEPTLILWGITRELRLLVEIALERKAGSTFEAIFQKKGVFAKRQANIKQFLSRASIADCLHYLKAAGTLDKMIKGVLPYSAWQALQLFCLRMV
jgi:DNA polymerase-3 subunit delta